MTTWQGLAGALRTQMRELLERSGRSQRDLAGGTGTTQSTVSQVFNGRHQDMRLSTLVRLATGLRHDVGIVFIPRGEPYRWCGDRQCPGRHFIGAVAGNWPCHGAPMT